MAHLKEFEHLKISSEAINLATNNYSDNNCIGSGGFGKVYKGEIVHSQGKSVVALKRLDRKLGQGDPEFWKEVMMLSHYKHENIVSLVGYCDDYGEKILLYQYASKKSLDRYLQKEELAWVRRLKICIGAANGLAYLHTPTGDKFRVLHRDIKSANILLDENWNAKISDFGLSKVAPAFGQFTHLITDAVGTDGYIDPEYRESGLLTKESDVYSFGVVLFEVFTEIAYQCLERERTKRPSMKEIVEALERALVYQCPDPDAEAKVTPIKQERSGSSYGGVRIDFTHYYGKSMYQDVNQKAKMEAEAKAKPKAKWEAEAKAKAKMGPEERERQGILEVKLIRATDSILKSSKYYFIVTQLLYTDIHKTTAKHNNLNTEWNEEFALYVKDLTQGYLEIHLINMVSAEKHDYLGRAKVFFCELKRKNHNIVDLNIRNERNKFICILRAELVFKPFAYNGIPSKIKDMITIPKAPYGTPTAGGLLVVIIHRAELKSVRENHINASVTLLFKGDTKTTLCMMNTKNPVWGQKFTYILDWTPTTEDLLHLEIFDNSWMWGLLNQRKEAKFLGFCDIRLEDVVYEKRSSHNHYTETGDKIKVELQWRTSY